MPERVKQETEDYVKTVPIPESTESYIPVSNNDLIETLEECLQERGLYPCKKTYTTAYKGQEIFGDWILCKENDPLFQKERFDPGDIAFGVSFINSYNKKLKMEIVPGIRVCVCSNQAMSRTGVSVFERKHTGDIHIEFPIFIQNSLEKLDLLYDNFQEAFSRLRQVQISKKIMSELAGRMYIQEDLITSEQISLLRKEILKPTFPQFNESNGFNFYQHCTYSIRNSHPAEIIDRYVGVHEFVTNVLL